MTTRSHGRGASRRTPPKAAEPPAPAGDALRQHFQRVVRGFGLLSTERTPCGQPLSVSHAHALMVLLEQSRLGRTPTQQQLGAALGIDKSNVARLCRKMEQAGQLSQARAPDDGRARLLALTERGVRVATNVERSSRDRFEQLMSAIPGDARGAVLSALSVLGDAIAGAVAPGAIGRAPRAGSETEGS